MLITTQVIGADRVIGRIESIRRRATDLREFWEQVFAPHYFANVQDGFAVEGLHRSAGGQFIAGTKWAPLSPSYRAWKAKHFPGKPILTREGPLRESLRWSGTGLGPGGIWEARETSVRLGTAVRHGAPHMRQHGNRPARPFIAPADKKVYAPMLKAWLREKAQG